MRNRYGMALHFARALVIGGYMEETCWGRFVECQLKCVIFDVDVISFMDSVI